MDEQRRDARTSTGGRRGHARRGERDMKSMMRREIERETDRDKGRASKVRKSREEKNYRDEERKYEMQGTRGRRRKEEGERRKKEERREVIGRVEDTKWNRIESKGNKM